MSGGPTATSGGRAVPIAALTDPDRLRSLADTGLGARSDEAFDRFARLVADLLDVPVALVTLVDADRQFFPGETGLPEPWAQRRETPLSHSFCQHVVDLEAPMVLPDTRRSPRMRDNSAVPDLGVVAYAGMPLTDLDGRVLGSLCAIDRKPRAWTAAQLRTLADLAAACSSELRLRIAIDGAEQARRRAEEAHERLALLAGVSETMAGSSDVATALRQLGATMVPLLADWCLVSVVGPDGQIRDVAAAHRDPDRTADVARFADLMRTRLGPESITRAVLRTGQPVLASTGGVDDVRRGSIGPEMAEIAERLGLSSHLTVPISDIGRGRVLGAVTLVNTPGRRHFDDHDLLTAVEIGRRAGQAIGDSSVYGEQRHVAHVLQHSMLSPLPPSDGLELAARYHPAADRVEVGGDWYDAFRQPDGDLIAAIGDVAGHDIEAAATMGQLRNLVRGNAFGRADTPGELIRRLDDTMRGLRISTAATAVLVRIRPDGRGGQSLSWCNAGHPAPLVVRAGGAVEPLAATPEPLLGLTRPVRRATHQARLAPGDTLLLLTDGLVERRDRAIDVGLAELAERLRGTGAVPLDRLCDLLVASEQRREDDVALLAVRAR